MTPLYIFIENFIYLNSIFLDSAMSEVLTADKIMQFHDAFNSVADSQVG
jgi:hypothetical protein